MKHQKEFFVNSNQEFREQLIEVFGSSYTKTNPNYAKLIAWCNKTVMQSNPIIRDLVFGEDVRLVEKGDILTGYRVIKANSKEPF